MCKEWERREPWRVGDNWTKLPVNPVWFVAKTPHYHWLRVHINHTSAVIGLVWLQVKHTYILLCLFTHARTYVQLYIPTYSMLPPSNRWIEFFFMMWFDSKWFSDSGLPQQKTHKPTSMLVCTYTNKNNGTTVRLTVNPTNGHWLYSRSDRFEEFGYLSTFFHITRVCICTFGLFVCLITHRSHIFTFP